MRGAMRAWYRADVLDALAGHLALDPALATDDDLTFRDEAGTWWRPQRDGSWIASDGGVWRQAARPDSLEGVVPLPTGISPSPGPGSPTAWSAPGPEVPAPARLASFVDHVRRCYRAGEVVSTMAELVLVDSTLLTGDGRLWTVGARSGSWYVHDGSGWAPADGLPPGPFLSHDEAVAILRRRSGPAWRFAQQGRPLPEPLTPDWSLPAPPGAIVPSPGRR